MFKHAIRTVPILFALGFSVFGQVQQRDQGSRSSSISGRVTIHDKPVVNAQVTIVNTMESLDVVDRSAGKPPPIPVKLTARTDGDGRYHIYGLPAGRFFVSAHSKAFIHESPDKNNQPARAVLLDEGESRENFDFVLVPGGVITGRVTDPTGRPVIATRIQLYKIDQQGRKNFYQAGFNWEMFETDDRGIYRIYALPAGRYLLCAGDSSFFNEIYGSERKYARTCHPDAADENQAKIIELDEGQEATGIDISIREAVKGFDALGRVTDSETGQPVPSLPILWQSIPEEGNTSGGSGGIATTDAQGNFRLANLPAGRYFLMIAQQNVEPYEADYYNEKTVFEVRGEDVSGIELKAIRGASINGIMAFEGVTDPAVRARIPRLQLSVMPIPDPSASDVDPLSPLMGSRAAKINDDGSFRISGLPSGMMRFFAYEPGGRVPILRIERNGADVGEGIQVNKSEQVRGVRVILGYGTGIIRGQIQIGGGRPPEGSTFGVTIRATGANQESGGYSGVDEKGRFVVQGLMPGEYEVHVQLNRMTPGGGFQTQPVSGGIRRVTVANGTETKVTLTVDLGTG